MTDIYVTKGGEAFHIRADCPQIRKREVGVLLGGSYEIFHQGVYVRKPGTTHKKWRYPCWCVPANWNTP